MVNEGLIANTRANEAREIIENKINEFDTFAKALIANRDIELSDLASQEILASDAFARASNYLVK